MVKLTVNKVKNVLISLKCLKVYFCIKKRQKIIKKQLKNIVKHVDFASNLSYLQNLSSRLKFSVR